MTRWLLKGKVNEVLGVLIGLIVSIVAIYKNIGYIKVDGNYNNKYSEYILSVGDAGLTVKSALIKTELGNYNVYVDGSIINGMTVNTLDNYGDLTYITLLSKDKNTLKEILICRTLPKELSLEGLSKYKLMSKDKRGGYTRYLRKIKRGYLLMSVSGKDIDDNKLQEEIINVATNLKYTKNNHKQDVVLNIDGLKKIKMSDISVFKDGARVFYGQDRIFRLYNQKKDKVYMWITHLNNALLMNTAGNLEPTEYNNIYRDMD